MKRNWHFVWWWNFKNWKLFASGYWPREKEWVFRYWRIGPLEIRVFISDEEISRRYRKCPHPK